MKLKKNQVKSIGNISEVDTILTEYQSATDRNAELIRELNLKNQELQIEGYLEKVSNIALSMKYPADMVEVCREISDQMMAYGIKHIRNVQTALIDDGSNTYINYQYFTPYGQSSIEEAKYNKHPKVFEMVQKMQHTDDAFYVIDFEGSELEEFRQYRKEDNQFPDPILDTTLSLHYYFYGIGGGWLGLSTYRPLPAKGLDLFRRFHKVFGLAYRRFIDIQNAEKLAKEAIHHSALNRLRAQIASMRSTADLQNITPLIWKELKVLGLNFIRCGVIIIDEAAYEAKIYLNTPDETPLGTLRLPLNYDTFIANTYAHWKIKKIYTEHWSGKQFNAWTNSMLSYGQIKDPVTYQGNSGPPASLDLHFVPFDQGILYIGSTTPLSEEELLSAKSLAEAFEVAYARYEDFAQIKKAKEKVEHTLTELKATQAQLVQIEKMASLGELAAGISHEILNPLNFVNNFSEVSKELLDDMEAEMQAGNYSMALEILSDIKENLKKITLHGKRADAIVKGMLQHSHDKPGLKEPTDLNALADEYFRLAYHGLRAREKSFNTKMETDFDSNVGKVNLYAQDMGRVILNLITNAFYAVNLKSKQQIPGYSPTVKLQTKRIKKGVELKVTDNGNGIEEQYREKIFHPFFTTKPAGEGTGLGLSISFDIVTNGHGGQLSMETRIGEGTEFTLFIPD